MTIIGDNIKKLRERNGLTLRELAQKSCVGQSTINDIEMGKAQNPKIETLNKISETLNVSLDYLLKKSVKVLIEDKLEELGMTLEELSTKTKIPLAFFEGLDNIMPDEADYERMQVTARTLNIDPIDLANALHRQEPPVYKKLTEWDFKGGNLMIGEDIKLLREARKISLSKLARLANISPGYLSDIEKGNKTSPSIDVLEKLVSYIRRKY